MPRRPRVVRLGIPALIVGGLALVALWRVGVPANPAPAGATGTPAAPAGREPRTPLQQVADLLTDNAIGREASLESVDIRQTPSPRTMWIGVRDDDPAFVVLDPDVKRHPDARLTPGARVAVVGLVRPSPPAAQAMRQWMLDAATAQAVEEAGTYLHVTEVRPSL